MTTIAETTGKLPDVIDSIASAATALTEWSDADTGVTNDQSSTNYVDNGRVLEHGPSGMYVGLFLHSVRTAHESDDNIDDYGAGIRIVHSTGWDTSTNSPSGNTDTNSGDPWSGDTGNHYADSFTTVDQNTGRYNLSFGDGEGSTGVYILSSDETMSSLQSIDVTYFASVTSDWINLAMWNTQDGSNGCAGYYCFEYPSSKFWPDGNTPYYAYSQSNNSSGTKVALNSFNTFYGHAEVNQSFPFDASGFDPAEWCIVNPASDDDTHFFRRGVAYQSSSGTVPVAYLLASIGNDINEGGAHGDTIDHSGETYRVFRQSGAGSSTTITAGLRYE